MMVTPVRTRSAADLKRPIALDQSGVADTNPGDVGDRVQRPGDSGADLDAQLSRPHWRQLLSRPTARW